MDAIFGGAGKIATEPWNTVELLPQEIFEVTAGFVDPSKILNGTVRRVHALHHFVQDVANVLDDARVGFILRIDGQHSISRGVKRLPC